MSIEELVQTVHFFRQLGFFGQYRELSDRALADELEQQYMSQWGIAFDPSDELADLSILCYDKERVWWEDLEADVCDMNEVYVATLKAFASISRGAFLPQDISETWKNAEGPIHVDFMLDGIPQRIQPEYQDDYIDIAIVTEINKLIAHGAYRFEVYDAFDQTAFVLVLTPDEKRKLEQERGWRFMEQENN